MFNYVQVEVTAKIPKPLLNLPKEIVLKFGGMQITRMTGHTAGCLILPNNAVHEEFKDQVMHTHVKGENLQPRTLMVIP